MSKRDTLAKILYSFGEVYDKQITEPLQELYFNALDELTEDQIRHAANVLTKTARFFPKPVDFLEAAKGTPSDREFMIEADALNAWESLIADPDVYTTVMIEDPVAARALLTLGGWIEFCNIPDDQMKWAKKDFIKAYKAFYRDKTLIPRKFIGLLEQNNERDGYSKNQIDKEIKEICFPNRTIEAPEKQIGRREAKQITEATK